MSDLIAALEQIRTLTYHDADKLHRMTHQQKARSLAATLVAVAVVASLAIKEASDCRPTNP